MVAIEQQTTSLHSVNTVDADPVMILPEGAVRKMKDLLLPESSSVWIAPLPPNNFRLLHTYDVLGGLVRKVEIIESKRGNGPNHARLYLSPTEDHIPTLIIGEYAGVAHSAWRDGRPAFPLSHNAQEIRVGSTALKYPEELVRLPGINDLLQNQPKIMFTIRPSSFLLQSACILELDGTIVKAKTYVNYFIPGHVFCHVTSPDEWSEALPGIHGVVLTNSEAYTMAHPELCFAEASDG